MPKGWALSSYTSNSFPFSSVTWDNLQLQSEDKKCHFIKVEPTEKLHPPPEPTKSVFLVQNESEAFGIAGAETWNLCLCIPEMQIPHKEAITAKWHYFWTTRGCSHSHREAKPALEYLEACPEEKCRVGGILSPPNHEWGEGDAQECSCRKCLWLKPGAATWIKRSEETARQHWWQKNINAQKIKNKKKPKKNSEAPKDLSVCWNLVSGREKGKTQIAESLDN